MINTSADYKTAIAATDREMRGYVKFNGDSTKIMRGCDGLISIVTTAQIADEERPMLGCACASICEMTFYNSGLPAGVSLANSYFDAYVGIVLEDTGSAPIGSIEPDTATVEYVWMGRFTIDTIDRSKLSTKVTGYDDFSKLNKPYVCNVAETPSGYPINQIIGDIRTQCGLTASSTPSTNMGYVPTIYECTCRQMYGWVMSLYSLGCNWLARGNDVQYNYYTTVWGAMQYKDDPGHLITDDTIYLGGVADSPTFTFNSVVTGTADNPVSVGSGTGIFGENPYFDAARATLLYNNINGLTFTPMTIEWRGDPAIQQGDIMKVVTGGNTYYTYVQRIVSTFNGGFKQTFECFGDSEYHYDMSTSPTQAQIKTAVSNMAQEIQQEIETADNGVITKVLDLDGSWKELVIANNQDLSAATSVWRWNINGLAHSTSYSGGTYNFAVDMNGRIIANVIQTGTLQDAANKNSWNLDTGALTITDGSISITTSSENDDKITLTYGNYQSTVKAGGFTFSYKNGSVYKNRSTLQLDGVKYYDFSGNKVAELGANGPTTSTTASGLLSCYKYNSSFAVGLGVHGAGAGEDTNAGVCTAYYQNDGMYVNLGNGTGFGQVISLRTYPTYNYTEFDLKNTNANSAIYMQANNNGGSLSVRDGTATERAQLETTYLTFKNSSGTNLAFYKSDGILFQNSGGTVTATYPATGLQKLTGATDSTSATGCVYAVPPQTFSSATTQQAAAEALLKYICANYPNKTSCTFIGNYITTANRRGYELYVSATSTVNSDGLPQYASGIVYEISTTMMVYSVNCVSYAVKLSFATPIISGTETADINNCTENGLYYYTAAASNNPTGTGGTILSTKFNSAYSGQLLFSNSADDTGARLYYRRKNTNGWQALRGIMAINSATGKTPYNESVADYAVTSGTTKTYALVSGHTYIVSVVRRNTTSTNQDGVWICSVHSTNSHLTALRQPTVTYTISVSTTTLSITTWDNYMNISILDLGVG